MFETVSYLIFRNLGWLFAVAGLIVPVMLLVDEFTATPARAKIIAIDSVCEKRVCALGRCNWQKIECNSMQALTKSGAEVRRRPRARVELQTDQGRTEVWADYSKLKIESAKVGDEVDVLYRGPAPYYIKAPFATIEAVFGILVSLLGVLFLMITGRLKRKEG